MNNSQKGLVTTVVLIVVIVLLVIVGGIYLYSQKTQVPLVTNTQVNSAPLVVTPISVPAVTTPGINQSVQTNNPQTTSINHLSQIYTNNQYGFQINYPVDWTSSSDVMSESFSNRYVKGSNEFTCSTDVAIITTAGFDKYFSSYYSKGRPPQTTMQINGASVIKIGNLPNITQYWIKANGGQYSFEIDQQIDNIITNSDGVKVSYGYFNDPGCTSILNQMISSFKFTK